MMADNEHQWRRVWIKRRKNPRKEDGEQTVSYTLQWKDDDGKTRFQSLGPGATEEYARQQQELLEQRLNGVLSEPELVALAVLQKGLLIKVLTENDTTYLKRKGWTVEDLEGFRGEIDTNVRQWITTKIDKLRNSDDRLLKDAKEAVEAYKAIIAEREREETGE